MAIPVFTTPPNSLSGQSQGSRNLWAANHLFSCKLFRAVANTMCFGACVVSSSLPLSLSPSFRSAVAAGRSVFSVCLQYCVGLW